MACGRGDGAVACGYRPVRAAENRTNKRTKSQIWKRRLRRRRHRWVGTALSLSLSLSHCGSGGGSSSKVRVFHSLAPSVDIWDARKKQLAGAKWLTAFHVGAILLSFGGKSGTCLRRGERKYERTTRQQTPLLLQFLLGWPHSLPTSLSLSLSLSLSPSSLPPSSVYRVSY